MLLVLAFGLDLVTAWPFWRASAMLDTTFVISGAVLAYLTWNALKAIR